MTQIPDENTLISYFHRDDEMSYKAFTWIVDLYSKRLYTTIRRWINIPALVDGDYSWPFYRI